VVAKVKPLQDAAAALGIAQVTKATDQFIALVNQQVAIHQLMAKFKKPADISFLSKLGSETWT